MGMTLKIVYIIYAYKLISEWEVVSRKNVGTLIFWFKQLCLLLSKYVIFLKIQNYPQTKIPLKLKTLWSVGEKKVSCRFKMKPITPIIAKPSLNVFCMPGSILSPHLILTTTLGCKYFYLIFVRWGNWGTETTCPRLLSAVSYQAILPFIFTIICCDLFITLYLAIILIDEKEQRKCRQLDNITHN